MKKLFNQRYLIKRSFFNKKPKPELQEHENEILTSIKPIIDNMIDETLSTRIPLIPKSDNKPTMFLEIEGVLFNCYSPHPTEGYITRPNKVEDFSIDLVTKEYYENYLIYMRPHYQEFINYIEKNFEVILFTFCREEFAIKLFETINTVNWDFLKFKLFQDSCSHIQSKEDGLNDLTKVLQGFNRDLNSSFLIDTRPIAFIAQPNNSIPVSEYNCVQDTNNKDKTLLEIINFLEEIKDSKDIPTILKNKFKIESVLREINLF